MFTVLVCCLVFISTYIEGITQLSCNGSVNYRHYSAKTLYEDVRDKQPPTEQTISGCQPSMLYLLVRHGSRYPGDDDIIAMENLLPDLRDRIVEQFNKGLGQLCPNNITPLVNWTLRLALADEKKLATVGYQEMVDLAQRFRARFPTLLKQEFVSSELVVRSTYKDRTKESAKGFLEGLFNRTDIEPEFKPKGQDTVLRFYDVCQRYQDELDDAPIPQYDRFSESTVFKQVIRDVETRLGLPTHNLTSEAFFSMYRMCVFDHVLYSDSPWCAVFSEQNLKVMEYREDLKYFYSYGPGAPELAHLQACGLMQDFFTHTRNGASYTYSGPKAVLRFAHSQGVQTFMTSLGLFKDSNPPTADNMATQANRKWQTSVVGPFGANIAVAVYTCQNTDQAKVKVFVNDKPIDIPGCGAKICDLNQVFKESRNFANTCDFKAICTTVTSQPGASPMVHPLTFTTYLVGLFVMMYNIGPTSLTQV